MARKKLSDEQVAYAGAEYHKGRDTPSIATELGVSASTVVLYMKNAGIPRRPRGMKPVPPEIIQATLDLKATGLAWPWIAKRIGYSVHTLKKKVYEQSANDAKKEQAA